MLDKKSHQKILTTTSLDPANQIAALHLPQHAFHVRLILIFKDCYNDSVHVIDSGMPNEQPWGLWVRTLYAAIWHSQLSPLLKSANAAERLLRADFPAILLMPTTDTEQQQGQVAQWGLKQIKFTNCPGNLHPRETDRCQLPRRNYL